MNQYYRPYNSGFGGISPAIKFIIVANLLVFVLQNLLFSNLFIGGVNLNVLVRDLFALQPFDKVENTIHVSTFLPWQLITYQFMHGDFFHIFFNMFGVWMFGNELEQMWGTKKFAAYYILSGIGAGLVQLFVADAPTVGASGSLFGLLAAFGFLFPDRKIFMFPIFIPIPARIFVIIYGAIQLVQGFSDSSSNVAHFAHVGGAIAGLFLLKFGDQLGIFRLVEKMFSKVGKSSNRNSYNPYNDSSRTANVYQMNRKEKEERIYEYREPQTTSEKVKSYIISGEEVTQSKIDAILDKISVAGYQSLSDKEKHILSELSKKI